MGLAVGLRLFSDDQFIVVRAGVGVAPAMSRNAFLGQREYASTRSDVMVFAMAGDPPHARDVSPPGQPVKRPFCPDVPDKLDRATPIPRPQPQGDFE